MEHALILSTLPKTWIFDLDGTLVKHNGYKIDGKDTLLNGVKEYLDGLTEEYREQTMHFLLSRNVRFDQVLFNMPMGERILVNDRKPSGLDMAIAFNLERDHFVLPPIMREQ